MRRFTFLLVTSCLHPQPRYAEAAPKPPVTVAQAEVVVIAREPVVRREWQHPHIGNATVVAESTSIECWIGSTVSAQKSGVWLRLPPTDCAGSAIPGPDHWSDAKVFSSNVEDTNLEHRVVDFGNPIDWLAPGDGVRMARRLLGTLGADAKALPSYKFVSDRLALYEDNGAITRDAAKARTLCTAGNGQACQVAASLVAKPDERRALLRHGCELQDRDACYAYGVELRTDAMEAIKKTKEVQAFVAFQCSIGKSSSITPIAYETIPCPPPSAPLAH